MQVLIPVLNFCKTDQNFWKQFTKALYFYIKLIKTLLFDKNF